jgi:multidrug efflux pump subunit AcrA (membrane-fusion protein)
MVIFVAITLVACEARTGASSSEAARETPQSDASQKGAKDSSVIVLDATQQQNGHVVVAPVRVTDIAATLTIPGRLTVSEDRTWHVGAIASGRIETTTVRVGDAVTAGQILGSIHSHEVHEARAGYQEATTELQRAESAELYAKQRRDRTQRSSISRPERVRTSSRRRPTLRTRKRQFKRLEANLRRNVRIWKSSKYLLTTPRRAARRAKGTTYLLPRRHRVWLWNGKYPWAASSIPVTSCSPSPTPATCG